MTKLQKYIASCSDPYYGHTFNKEQVTTAKQLARGKYWHERDNYQYIAFSPTGLKRVFLYCVSSDVGVYKDLNKIIRHKARLAAKLWSQGKYKSARLVESTTID